MKVIALTAFGLDQFRFEERPEPQPGPAEVLIRVRAVSLNYRDLLVARGVYHPRLTLPRVLGSDAAGEVLAVGVDVRSVRVGDRVCGTFFQDWPAGPITESAARSALGGALEGVLAEQVVLREQGVVPMPDGLSFAEAATLPCAGVTAWNALSLPGGLQSKTVLVLGTGGVSVFALQFAVALGARVLVVSSSDEKLARARGLGAADGINYRSSPEWGSWARAQCGGAGVDLVVEVGGAGTLERSVQATRVGGQIALVGVLAGGASFNPLPMMMKAITLRGIFVGSREHFLQMNEAIQQYRLRPIVDCVVPWEEFPAALTRLTEARHFGKVVLAVGGPEPSPG